MDLVGCDFEQHKPYEIEFFVYVIPRWAILYAVLPQWPLFSFSVTSYRAAFYVNVKSQWALM